MLRDQFVWGLKNDAIQQKLLGEVKLTFKRAMELAQGLETAAQNVQTLKASIQGSDPGKLEVRKITNAGKGLLVIAVARSVISPPNVVSRTQYAISMANTRPEGWYVTVS